MSSLDSSPPEPVAPAATARLSGLGRRLLAPLGLLLIVVLGLTIYGDARLVAARLRQFDLAVLPAVLALSLANYALRFGRWQLYLRRLEIGLTPWHSLLVFLVGFVLTVTPGKLGELGKAWLARELGGGPARRAVAAVLAERISDLLAVLALACVGSLAFPGLAAVAWVGLGLTAAATALVAWPPFVAWLVATLGRLRPLAGRVAILVDIQDQLRCLLAPGMLLGAVGLAILAWGAEGLGFALVVDTLGGDASWLAGVFNYSLGSLVGGLAMLPGGLVATEGALTALLGAQGLEPAAAATATLVVRAATLWFAVLLGLVALPFLLAAVRRCGGGREVAVVGPGGSESEGERRGIGVPPESAARAAERSAAGAGGSAGEARGEAP